MGENTKPDKAAMQWIQNWMIEELGKDAKLPDEDTEIPPLDVEKVKELNAAMEKLEAEKPKTCPQGLQFVKKWWDEGIPEPGDDVHSPITVEKVKAANKILDQFAVPPWDQSIQWNPTWKAHDWSGWSYQSNGNMEAYTESRSRDRLENDQLKRLLVRMWDGDMTDDDIRIMEENYDEWVKLCPEKTL